MTQQELIEVLKKRRIEAEEEQRRARLAMHSMAWNAAFGRIREIDELLLILSTNLITP